MRDPRRSVRSCCPPDSLQTDVMTLRERRPIGGAKIRTHRSERIRSSTACHDVSVIKLKSSSADYLTGTEPGSVPQRMSRRRASRLVGGDEEESVALAGN